MWLRKSLANNELKQGRLRLAVCYWIYRIIHNFLKLNREISFQLREIEIVGVAAIA